MAGRVANPKTQQEYIDKLIQQYSLDGEGRDNTREKDILDYAAPYISICRAFAKEKIRESLLKLRCVKCVIFNSIISSSHSFLQLGLDQFTEDILKSKKLCHKVSQGEATDQTQMMRNLETGYSSLKEKYNDQGKQHYM